MNKKQKIEKADRKIRIFDLAVDQARSAGNRQAAAEFNESLHRARMARLRLGRDDGR